MATEARHNWNLPEANEPEADTAAYLTGCAKTRLYGVAGEEQADPKAAYRSLWFAEHYLRDALRHIEKAKDRIGCDHGLDDSEFGLISPKPVVSSLSKVA